MQQIVGKKEMKDQLWHLFDDLKSFIDILTSLWYKSLTPRDSLKL